MVALEIRSVSNMADCRTCRALASAVWGAESACSAAQISVHAKYGGVVLLAFDEAVPIGFVFSFPALYCGETVLWSHETAVLKTHLHRGIGYQLKCAQRARAAELGYETIAWTFDPLVARNAHFNLNKLGARVSEYKVNAYDTDDSDQVNRGLQTDRFIAVWDVNPERRPTLPDHRARASVIGAAAEMIETAIPADFERMAERDRAEAVAWRLAFRDVAQKRLREGYKVDGLVVRKDETAYVWRR